MNYNQFTVSNQYDLKNRSQNNMVQSNMSNQQYRNASPNTNQQNSSNGFQNGMGQQNYYMPQSPISNSNQGYQYQLNNNPSQGDFSAKQINSPLNLSQSQQIQKQYNAMVANNNQQQQQIQSNQQISGGTLNNIPSYQNVYQQPKQINQNSGLTVSNSYQNMYIAQSSSTTNFNAGASSREKSPIVLNNANNSAYNVNSHSYLSSHLASSANKKSSVGENDQNNKIKGSLSPLNRQGYQTKLQNMNFSNFTQNKINTNGVMNGGSQYNNEDKNKINQSQQFGNTSPMMTYTTQNVNQSVQGPLTSSGIQSYNNQQPLNNLQNSTNISSSNHNQIYQNNQYTPSNSQLYQSNSAQGKEQAFSSGSKSARNIKEQIKQIGNAVSSTQSKNVYAPIGQREFKSNEGIQDNSIRQQTTYVNQGLQNSRQQANSPLNYKQIDNIQSTQDASPNDKFSYYQNNFYKPNTPNSYNNNLIQSNIINVAPNDELKVVQYSGNTSHSNNFSSQININDKSTRKENGYPQFQSDQKTQQTMNISGQNKSASNSRNISPQSISANLSSSNLSNSQTPRTQSKNNSQSGSSLSVTQQLFSKKLQEQRTTNLNQLPQQNLNQSQTQQKIQSNQRQDSSSQLTQQRKDSSQMQQQIQDTSQNSQQRYDKSQSSTTQLPSSQIYQNISNQPSTNNLNHASQNEISTKIIQNQQIQSIPQIPQNISDVSSNTQQSMDLNTQQYQKTKMQTLPSESNSNGSGIYNKENESKQLQKTNSDSSQKDQNWQQWWSEKRKQNLKFIQNAKLNKYNDCMNCLDKKKGDQKADINYKDEEQNTALHYASQNGNVNLVNLLLYSEAHIDSQNQFMQTPLMFACIEGHEDICQILITAGADINNYDSKENTALHFASMNGHNRIVEMLLRKPSLLYKKKNLNNQEAQQVASNEAVQKVFENFFDFQNQLLQNQQKLMINEVQTQNVQQMFQKVPQNAPEISVENKNNQVFNKKSSENDNKSSINEKNSTSDESKSSFNADKEEKVGPNDFIVHGLIGKGSFGEVYLVEKKGSQMLYAMKVLHKSKIVRNNLTKYAMTERNVMSLTNHPFIVKLNYAFQTSDKLFLIMDYCPGGDLGEHLQKEKKFSEDLVKIYLAETTLALEDLHKRDVIFRDLKPDNIVLDYEGHVKLTDFGLSKEGVLDHSSGARSFCGSVAYLAPEMLKRCGHGKAVDWYLLGVVMYELLVGIPPYYANNRDELFYNIEKAPLKIPSYLSNEARSLLKALLQRNPTKRLGSGKGDAEEIKVHPFFNDIDWNNVYQRKLKPPRPNRKIRISTKVDPNLFAETDYQGDKDYVAGWSFVCP